MHASPRLPLPSPTQSQETSDSPVIDPHPSPVIGPDTTNGGKRSDSNTTGNGATGTNGGKRNGGATTTTAGQHHDIHLPHPRHLPPSPRRFPQVEFWICLVLTFFGYFPGTIYAIWVIVKP